MSADPFKPFLYMSACLLLGGMILGLLAMADVRPGIARLAGDIGFVGSLGCCVRWKRSFRPVPVLAGALAMVAGFLALLFLALATLPRSLPLLETFWGVFDLGYVPDGGIHGPPMELLVTFWALSMLGLIGAGLLLGGILRHYWPRPEPHAEIETA